jgi:hypothetical protein
MKRDELSALFLMVWAVVSMWSSMRVFDKARDGSHLGERSERPRRQPACDGPFDLQYNSYPACGGDEFRQANRE